MREPTPRDWRHNCTCPGCGEPFAVPVLFGMTGAEAICNRCRTHFSVIGFISSPTYRVLPSGKKMPSWVGPPLPGDGRSRA